MLFALLALRGGRRYSQFCRMPSCRYSRTIGTTHVWQPDHTATTPCTMTGMLTTGPYLTSIWTRPHDEAKGSVRTASSTGLEFDPETATTRLIMPCGSYSGNEYRSGVYIEPLCYGSRACRVCKSPDRLPCNGRNWPSPIDLLKLPEYILLGKLKHC